MSTEPSTRNVQSDHARPTTTATRPRGEIRALTGLRAFAAAWVVVHHFWSLSVSDTWVPLLGGLHPFFANGWLGVDLFFVLSGFVLAHTYIEKIGDRPRFRASVTFWWNRLSRVWPLWAFVTVTFTAWLLLKHATVGGPHLHEGAQPSVGVLPLIEQLLMVQVWSQPHSYASGAVGPGWSLSAEWLAYCVFPVVVLFLYRLRRLPAVVLGAAALLAMSPFAYVVATQATHGWDWSWLVRIAGGFLAGAFTSMCVTRIRYSEQVARQASFVAAASLVAVLVVIWWAAMVQGDYGGIAALLFPVLVGALALADRGPAKILSREWAVMGGRISFALYLVHECMFEVWWTLGDVVPALGPDSRWQGLAAPLVLASTVPVAYLLWRYVEEPCRVRMRRISDGPRTDVPLPEPRRPEVQTRRFPELSLRPLPAIPGQAQPAQSELVTT